MTRMREVAARAPAALAACLLAACTSSAFDSEQPVQHVYVISAPQPQGSAPQVNVDVTVARPSVRPGLDTDRIAVLYPDRRLEYFAGSRWGANTDILVQSLLIESLRNAGVFRHVQSDIAAFAADFTVQSEVANFQAQYSARGGAPEVHIELIVTIGKTTQRRPVTSFVAAGRARAQANTLAAVVAAFEAAYAQASQVVVDETAAAVRAASAAEAAASAQNVESPVASISR